MEPVKSRIIQTVPIALSKLHPFQGEAKKMSAEAFNKLRKTILGDGFAFTLHVWETAGKIFIIDGHQRYAVLKSLEKQGHAIPKINCAFLDIKNTKEAKRLVFLSMSQFGKIQKEGFFEFLGDDVMEMEDFEFPDLDKNFFDLPDDDDDFDKDKGGLGTNVIISYQLIFDDEAQQEHWYDFLKGIKNQYPKAETMGERVVEFLKENWHG